MRTTVTLDPDVERLLRDEMHRTRNGFKETLNAVVRNALSLSSEAGRGEKFQLAGPFLGRLQPELQRVNFNHLADQLEDEALVGKLKKQSGE